MIARLAPAVLFMACGGPATSVAAPKPVASRAASSASPTPIDATPMLGPFAHEIGACDALATACPSANGCTCSVEGPLVVGMTLFVTKDRAIPGRTATHVGVHGPQGWFVAVDGLESSIDPGKKEHVVVTPRGVRKDVILVGASVQGAFDFVEVTIGPDGQSERASVVLCAASSPSKVPSCFDPIRGPRSASDPAPIEIATDAAGIWWVDASRGLTLLVAAGDFTIHQEIPLEGRYLLRLP